MRRGKPMQRTWMRPSARGTKHGRRRRGWGRMAYLASRPCDVIAAFIDLLGVDVVANMVLVPGPHSGKGEVMHLGNKADPGGRRREDDDDTAKGCKGHHVEIDGDLGGLGRWYVALGREMQHAFRKRLIDRATAAWEALTPEQRADWDARAAAEWLSRKNERRSR